MKCVDFYRYACGGWLARTAPPPGEDRWARAVDGARIRNLEAVREILEELAESSSPDQDQARLGTFYAACMDEASIDKAAAALPEHFRLVFLLRDVEGLSTRDTAEALGITQANVKIRLMRARIQLRNSLAHIYRPAEGRP